MLCNYSDNADELELLIWCQGVIQLVCNGVNISKEGGRYHKKEDVSVLWNTNADRNEFTSVLVASLSKGLYNKQVEGRWRIIIDL